MVVINGDDMFCDGATLPIDRVGPTEIRFEFSLSIYDPV